MAEKVNKKQPDLFSRLHNFICDIPRLVTLQFMAAIHTHEHSRQVLVSESTRANPEGGQMVQIPSPRKTLVLLVSIGIGPSGPPGKSWTSLEGLVRNSPNKIWVVLGTPMAMGQPEESDILNFKSFLHNFTSTISPNLRT